MDYITVVDVSFSPELHDTYSSKVESSQVWVLCDLTMLFFMIHVYFSIYKYTQMNLNSELSVNYCVPLVYKAIVLNVMSIIRMYNLVNNKSATNILHSTVAGTKVFIFGDFF